MMPGMDGIEATHIIRGEIDTDYARAVPIIALTANAIVGNEEMFMKNGFQAFLSKPIDASRLDAILRRWVRDREREKQDNEILGTSAENKYEVNGQLPAMRKLEGMNMKEALERFGGDMDSLLEVLRSYVASIGPLIDKLNECGHDNLPEYRIIAHGIKGSSYGICAPGVGKMAEDQEHAARDGDHALVDAGHDAFIASAEKLTRELSAMLGEIDSRNKKPLRPKPGKELLKRLSDASAAFSMDLVDEVMRELEKYEYESSGELVSWLREQVNMMEFDSIRKRLAEQV